MEGQLTEDVVATLTATTTFVCYDEGYEGWGRDVRGCKGQHGWMNESAAVSYDWASKKPGRDDSAGR